MFILTIPCLLPLFLSAAGQSAQQTQPAGRIVAVTVPVVTGQGYFPVICKLRDGRLGVVLRGGAPHVGIAGRLDFIASTDNGRTWSAPVTIADSPSDDRNPAFGQAADGTLVCVYHVQQNYDEQGNYKPSLGRPSPIYVVRSSDGGKTWTKPVRIDHTPLKWGSPYGRIVTLPDGALLANIYGDYVPLAGDAGRSIDASRNCAYLFRSADNGVTWSFYSRIAVGYNETGLERLPGGRILAALRTNDPKIADAVAVCHSDDNGLTWSDPQLVTRPGQHPADLLALPGNRVLMVYGHRLPPEGIHAILSTDGGKTFPSQREVILCEDASNFDCGYPSSAILDDGRIITVYYNVKSKLHPEWATHCAALIYSVP